MDDFGGGRRRRRTRDGEVDSADERSATAARFSPTGWWKRTDLPSTDAAPRTIHTSSPRQPLLLPPCTPTNNEYQVGGFYEIDHACLPPKSPSQLRDVRIVMVSRKTRLDVTVRFPSMLSLREQYEVSGGRKRKMGGSGPQLDENFVMSSNHARRILRRPVPEREMESSQHMQSFWVVSSSTPNPNLSLEHNEHNGSRAYSVPSKESCQQALRFSNVAGWGLRRRINYVGKHKQNSKLVLSSPQTNQITGKEVEVANNKKSRARKVGKRKSKDKTKKIPRKEKEALVVSSTTHNHRWSQGRYKAAELKLMGILKARNAVLGNAIPRPELREEARKHIGDTGLLDHLLKHMAGKVVQDSKERFMRRHNSEGTMEYWVEDAELEELRKMGGMVNANWVPPLGWSTGDSILSGSCCMGCGVRMGRLREEVSNLTREMEQLQSQNQKREDQNAKDVQSETGSCCTALQERVEDLLRWKTKVEEDMIAMSTSLRAVKEEMKRMIEETRKLKDQQDQSQATKDKEKTSMETTTDNNNSTDGGKTKTKRSSSSSKDQNQSKSSSRAAKGKSSFRVCKPQGTFLWPNTTTTITMQVMSPRTTVGPYEDMFGAPTPNSASSITSPPFLLLPPPSNTPSNSGVSSLVNRSRSPRGEVEGGGGRYCFYHKEHVVLGERSATSDTTFLQSPHGLRPPPVGRDMGEATTFANGRMEGMVRREESSVITRGSSSFTISTDLALASPSYLH